MRMGRRVGASGGTKWTGATSRAAGIFGGRSARPDDPLLEKRMTERRVLQIVWGLIGSGIPSRRVRHLLLRRLLGGVDEDALVAMHVILMQPSNVFLGARTVVNAHCIGRTWSQGVHRGGHRHRDPYPHLDPRARSERPRAPYTERTGPDRGSRVDRLKGNNPAGVTIGRGAV